MNPLKVFNTLTGSKVVFEPLIPGQVRMYVCGVTVYDECHLGHARSALVFETIRRHLEHSGLAVTFVKNFTDVDDKIINRAHELGLPWQEVTKKYIAAYYRDMKRLRIEQATIENSAAYIGNWLKRLRDDRTLIVQAAAQAQKAADFILGQTIEQN